MTRRFRSDFGSPSQSNYLLGEAIRINLRFTKSSVIGRLKRRRAVLTVGEMKMKALSFAAAASLALTTAPSKAAITILTVSGNVTDGKICSLPAVCTDLTGQNYTMTYTIDDSVGSRFTAPGLYDELRGGTSISGSPPTPVTATAYIAGQTFVSNGSFWGLAETQSAQELSSVNDGQFYRAREQINVSAGNMLHFLENEFAANIYYKASPNDPMILDPITGLSSSSVGQVYYSNFDRNIGTGSYASYIYVLANTRITSAIYGSNDPGTSAVPEPESWILSILGFGFVGAAMRRRPQGQQWAAT